MNVANWANWCMIIETFGAALLGALSLAWRHHRKVAHLKNTVIRLEAELAHAKDLQRPIDR
jgi:uncharacterized integral membrane protein